MAKNKDNLFQVWAYSKSTQHDDIIRKTANADSFGSGLGPDGRDISFYADTEQDAVKMKDRLMQLSCVTKVEVYYPNGYRTFKNKKDMSKNTWKDFL